MKIAIAQINPRVGDVSSNLRKTLDFIEEARQHSAELVLFPELSLTGYPPRDLLAYSRIHHEIQNALERIRTASMGLGVIVGFVEKNPHTYGKPFFNSAAVFKNGKQIHVYRKRLLPYYDVFEDERYFEPGTEPAVFDWDGKKIGIAICEDIWNRSGFLERQYASNPLSDLRGVALSTLVVLSASPFHVGKPQQREELLSLIAEEYQTSIHYCNQVSGNDELLFDGASLVLNAEGKPVCRAPAFKESLLISGQTESGIWPQREEEWLTEALSFGLRDYVHKSGSQRVCLGLSGGVDSSVLAVIAVQALGRENVEGISLPTRFTSSASREDAIALSAHLGIEFKEFEIENTFLAFEKMLESLKPRTLTLENIQPRIRMTVLMAIANEGGKLLLNTSNKSEIATGYSTLYGDSAGALAPLGDLTKGQVVRLAEWLNREKAICRKESFLVPQLLS
ncbi:MAG: NAD(+) synthase [Proteobacteria bacterium]|nr:NAD(+) synthase [Pseudomonadota bacterium]